MPAFFRARTFCRSDPGRFGERLGRAADCEADRWWSARPDQFHRSRPSTGDSSSASAGRAGPCLVRADRALIRGTTGLIEIPAGASAAGANNVTIKLYPDADGRVGHIDVSDRSGATLGTLTQGATGFTIRRGASGRFGAVPLVISTQQALRDQGIVRQVHAAQNVGRQIVARQRALRQANPNRNNPRNNPARQPGQQRQNSSQRPGLQQPGQERPGFQRPGFQRRPPSRGRREERR